MRLIHFCVFVQMDSNSDGLVDFDEFVAATLHVHQLEETDSEKWQSRSQAAFSQFDFDGDGYITADELKIVSASVYHYDKIVGQILELPVGIYPPSLRSVCLLRPFLHLKSIANFLAPGHTLIIVCMFRQATGLNGSMDSILVEADIDGDGKISLSEFQKLLRQASLGSRTNEHHTLVTHNHRKC